MNLTPAEKSKELFSKMHGVTDYEKKQNALVAVNEVLELIKDIYCYDFDILNPYYQEVKKELQKL
jgi:hypothetical protein